MSEDDYDEVSDVGEANSEDELVEDYEVRQAD